MLSIKTIIVYRLIAKWQLRDFDDATLRRDIENKPEELQKLVNTYFHCG